MPGLDYAFTIRAEIGTPLTGAATPTLGDRLHIPITGSRVKKGRRSQARCAQRFRLGTAASRRQHAYSARYTLIADDGTPIMVVSQRAQGVSARGHAPAVARIVDPSDVLPLDAALRSARRAAWMAQRRSSSPASPATATGSSSMSTA
ncbi:MAG: hypothetical protein H6893_09350 [Brucellaceae bacterium]|nr:hypothetical protein [Brucellaceae bacterium]